MQVPVSKSMNIVINWPAEELSLELQSRYESDSVVGQTKRLYITVPWKGLLTVATTHSDTTFSPEAFHYDENEQSSSIRGMVAIIGTSLCKDVKFITVPATPFFSLGKLCEWVCKLLGIEPPINRRRVAFLTKDRSFGTWKMRSVTGFTCQYSNEEGINALALWYKQECWL